jgi:hypothetical protein
MKTAIRKTLANDHAKFDLHKDIGLGRFQFKVFYMHKIVNVIGDV